MNTLPDPLITYPEYQYQYDFLVLIGRFQPFHIGHEMVVKKALTLARQVIILIGSSNQPRTSKNPFNYHEREAMIYETFPNITNPKNLLIRQPARIICASLRDQVYNDQKWAADVVRIVDNIAVSEGTWTATPKSIAIIGHTKDETSYYLKMFPQWPLIEHEMNEVVSATDIRRLYFEHALNFTKAVVPSAVYSYMEQFQKSNDFAELVKEYEFHKDYIKQFAGLKYPPIFQTVDAVVVQSGHILLIQRKSIPGENLWAMPGGYLNAKERIIDGMMRELREETRLKVPTPVLIGNIKANRVFDHPQRSLRGRIITNCFLIELPAGPLPPVKGRDDAKKALWTQISDIKEEVMFEDHYHIIYSMLGKI